MWALGMIVGAAIAIALLQLLWENLALRWFMERGPSRKLAATAAAWATACLAYSYAQPWNAKFGVLAYTIAACVVGAFTHYRAIRAEREEGDGYQP